MKIVSNKFEGLWAVPTDHPITCANDAPWLIVEMKLEANPIKIWIRGANTMWFHADQCFVYAKWFPACRPCTLRCCQLY